MTRLEKIERDEQKVRERIAAMQAQLKHIDGQRTEQENLQIIQQVRALRLTRDELYTFINGGALPATLAGAIGNAAAPENGGAETGRIRRSKTRRNKADNGNGDNGNGRDNSNEPDGNNGQGNNNEPNAETPYTDNHGGDNGNGDIMNYESEVRYNA